MSFFKNLFSKETQPRKTGVFVNNQGEYEELDEMPGNGSINSIIEYLGFNIDQVHSVLPFSSTRLSNLAVKVFTKEIVFFITKEGVPPLTNQQIQQEIRNTDWEFEYSSMFYEDILNQAIVNKTFDHKFLAEVLDISKEEDQGFYYSEKLGYYLYFEDGILMDFDTSSGLNSAAKWLNDLNPEMYKNILKEAMHFQDSKGEAIEEANIQCDSLQMTPQSVENQFVPDFRNEFGNINFYNLYCKHYSTNCEIFEFINMNKGRYQSVVLDNGNIITVGKHSFQFDENGYLQK